MDMQKIFGEAQKLWNTEVTADLNAASWAAHVAHRPIAPKTPVGGEGAAKASAGGESNGSAQGASAEPSPKTPMEGDACKHIEAGKRNMLLFGENLRLMASLAERIGAGGLPPVNLVYMDPPYFTNREHVAGIRIHTPGGGTIERRPAFSDQWRGGTTTFEDGMSNYLRTLTARLIASKDLLAEDGCLWLHLDRRASHYAKVMLDMVFGGPDHLVNEIVWTYKSGGASPRRFANKHDTLLFYAKNKSKYKFFPQEEKSYNRGLRPYNFKDVPEYKDEFGWYTLVNMKDVWEIPVVGRTAHERTGYAAQKPEALIERVILSCTEEGDFCLDPFAGSGTLGAVAARLGRRWICMDESPLAFELAAKRLGIY